MLLFSSLPTYTDGFTNFTQMNFMEKLFLLFLPAIGVCISFLDGALLLKKALHGIFVAHHEWFFRCSQFASWVRIYLFIWFLVEFFFIVVTCKNVLSFVMFSLSYWLLKNTQTLIILISKYFNGCQIFCNRILCFWWIIKLLLGILHSLTAYPPFKVHLFSRSLLLPFCVGQCGFSVTIITVHGGI